jgi:environmental stress-induced protein Ves
MSDDVRLRRAGDHRRMAWSNGGGTTYEVASAPEGAGLDGFGWRISLADIAASGPFSPFPGIDRTLVLVDGTGMELEVDGATTALRPRDVVRFAGEQSVSCRLTHGPTRDLNVMVRRGRFAARVEVVDVDGVRPLTAQPHELLVVVCLDGQVLLGEDVLAPRDAAVLRTRATLSGTATVVVVHLHPSALPPELPETRGSSGDLGGSDEV